MMKKLNEEICSALERAGREHCGFPEVDWFLDRLEGSFSAKTLKQEKPSLIVLGEDFP